MKFIFLVFVDSLVKDFPPPLSHLDPPLALKNFSLHKVAPTTLGGLTCWNGRLVLGRFSHFTLPQRVLKGSPSFLARLSFEANFFSDMAAPSENLNWLSSADSALTFHVRGLDALAGRPSGSEMVENPPPDFFPTPAAQGEGLPPPPPIGGSYKRKMIEHFSRQKNPIGPGAPGPIFQGVTDTPKVSPFWTHKRSNNRCQPHHINKDFEKGKFFWIDRMFGMSRTTAQSAHLLFRCLLCHHSSPEACLPLKVE